MPVTALPPGPVTTAVSPDSPGTSPSGQVRDTEPAPLPSVVKVAVVTSPSGPFTVTVYSVSGSRFL